MATTPKVNKTGARFKILFREHGPILEPLNARANIMLDLYHAQVIKKFWYNLFNS